MSGPAAATSLTVAVADAGTRLDRWLRRQYPGLPQSRIERLLRTGLIRVGGGKVKAGHRLAAGDQLRLPSGLADETEPKERERPPVAAEDARMLREAVLYQDAAVIVINKPAGLAVQGGTRTPRHLDGMLDVLAADGERPRLVHRLDRDTSGALVLARTAGAAARLASAFRGRSVHKCYWALVDGVPRPTSGRIEAPLAKRGGDGHEQVVEDEDDGRPAVTLYRMVEAIGGRLAWLVLAPLTGRTHQIRAHCALLGTPIVGDGKYGRSEAVSSPGIAPILHLHARRIRLPHPERGIVDVTAPLPPHMAATWRWLGFDPDASEDIEPEGAHPGRARAERR
ncbi:MAG: RluA family pseudouridine synthase [Alphaproteobacteria bacterium]|nr:RluA family pseudouridine synthase [Alphaproteobacteria bacterium]